MPLAPHLSAEKRDDVLDLRFRTLRGIGLGGLLFVAKGLGRRLREFRFPKPGAPRTSPGMSES